ncbi:MAG: hypothetical protein R3B99_20135 [Polyangiales bacterium]
MHLALEVREGDAEVAVGACALVVGERRRQLAEVAPAELRVQHLVGFELCDHRRDGRLTRQLALLGEQTERDRLAEAADEEQVSQRGFPRRRVFVFRQRLGSKLRLGLGSPTEQLDHTRAERRVPKLVHAHAKHRGAVFERRLGEHQGWQQTREDRGRAVLVHHAGAPGFARQTQRAIRVASLQRRAVEHRLGARVATSQRTLEKTLVLGPQRRAADLEPERAHVRPSAAGRTVPAPRRCIVRRPRTHPARPRNTPVVGGKTGRHTSPESLPASTTTVASSGIASRVVGHRRVFVTVASRTVDVTASIVPRPRRGEQGRRLARRVAASTRRGLRTEGDGARARHEGPDGGREGEARSSCRHNGTPSAP